MVAPTTKQMYNQDIVWDVNDRYGHARAIRIKTPDGHDTNFSMVYGKNEKKNWIPVRPVSDRFEPIGTGQIIDKVIERLGGNSEIFTEKLTLGRGGVSQQVELILKSHEIRIGDVIEDENSDLIANGIISKNGDIWRPSVRVKNALDGTKSISVMAGWFRLVCSNGMIAEAWSGSSSRTIKIHTIHQVDKALNEIENFDFNVEEFAKMLCGHEYGTIPCNTCHRTKSVHTL